jgi:RNA polymerase sigma-70 factor (ECF subfamily)
MSVTKLTREQQATLIEASLQGDDRAFAILYRQYRMSVRAAVYSFVPPDAVDDLMQEVFLHAFAKMSNFRGDADFGTWLHRVAVNCALQEKRRLRNRQDLLTVSIDVPTTSSDGTEMPIIDPPAPTGDPLLKLHLQEMDRAIDCLSTREQDILRMRLEGLPFQKIAEVLNTPLPTVKTTFSRAIPRLRSLMGVRV